MKSHRSLISGGSWRCFVVVLLFLAQTSFGQKYQTIGPGSCGSDQTKCHASEFNNWYKNDPHKSSTDKLSDDQEKAESYAEKAGVGAANMYKGSSICMSCHGTAISGKESKEVEEGVSCESCHGPGSGYKEPHQEGTGGGVTRPGYVKGVATGMGDFKRDKKAIAVACVRCHYITDQKTLAAGHSMGEKFNYVSAMKKVAKHWKRTPGDDDLVKQRFEDAKKAKSPGGVVKISPPPPPKETVKPKKPEVATQEPPEAAGTEVTTTPAPQQDAPRPTRRPPPPPTTPAPDPTAIPISVGAVELPPFPVVTDSTRLDSLLLLMKQRLELLYQKTR